MRTNDLRPRYLPHRRRAGQGIGDPATWKATEAVAAELQKGRYVEEDQLRYIIAEAKGERIPEDD
jgi:hypothetical protein